MLWDWVFGEVMGGDGMVRRREYGGLGCGFLVRLWEGGGMG